MRKVVDGIVIACMFVAIYINWTDFPKAARVESGLLVKIGVKE
jgi:hypothetical protein